MESTLQVTPLEFVSRAKLAGAAVSCPWWLGRLDVRAGDPSQPLPQSTAWDIASTFIDCMYACMHMGSFSESSHSDSITRTHGQTSPVQTVKSLPSSFLKLTGTPYPHLPGSVSQFLDNLVYLSTLFLSDPPLAEE